MILDFIHNQTLSFKNTKEKNEFKELGQYFTPVDVAMYMASLIEIKQESVMILDPGAGTGILSGAICERLLNNPSVKRVHIDVFELDDLVIPTLKSNLDFIKKNFESRNKIFTSNLFIKNFIAENTFQAQCDETDEKIYDVVICNPPYKKIRKESDESQSMRSIVYGQPNLYFLFIGMAVNLLKNEGQIVSITPRSFMSGLYFKKFRAYFLECMKIDLIHLFNSRKIIFRQDNVLQEVVIMKSHKLKGENYEITIKHSEDLHESNDLFINKINSNLIIDFKSEDKFIKIPTSLEDVKLLDIRLKWESNLTDLGYKVKTGPVVEFRLKSFIENENLSNTVPLIKLNNLTVESPQLFKTGYKSQTFIEKNNKTERYLLKSQDCIILKRFTTKETINRIQAVPYWEKNFSNEYIGIENHLNYIVKENEVFSKTEILGLLVLLNCSYLNKYFNLINGSTQVNANELKNLPLPNKESIIQLGKQINMNFEFSFENCDEIIKSLGLIDDIF